MPLPENPTAAQRSPPRFLTLGLNFLGPQSMRPLHSFTSLHLSQCCGAMDRRVETGSGATVRTCTANWRSRRWVACHVSECRWESCRRVVQRTAAQWRALRRCATTAVAAAACRSASVDPGTAYARSPPEHTETSPADRRCGSHPSDHTHLISQQAILLLPAEAMTVLFSASSISFFFSVDAITHEPLHLASRLFARTCNLTTSKSLLNIIATSPDCRCKRNRPKDTQLTRLSPEIKSNLSRGQE